MTKQMSLERSVKCVFGEHGMFGEHGVVGKLVLPVVKSEAKVFFRERLRKGMGAIELGYVLLGYAPRSREAILDFESELMGLKELIENPSNLMGKKGQVWQRVMNGYILDVTRDYGYPILERRKDGAVFGPIPIANQRDLDGVCEAAGLISSTYETLIEIEKLRWVR